MGRSHASFIVALFTALLVLLPAPAVRAQIFQHFFGGGGQAFEQREQEVPPVRFSLLRTALFDTDVLSLIIQHPTDRRRKVVRRSCAGR